MGGLIWMLIIVVVVYKMVQKNPKVQQDLQKTMDSAKEMMATTDAPAPNVEKPKRVMTDAERARLEEYCRKKVEKEQAKQAAAKRAETKPNDIVTRAKANSARYADTDATLQELESEHRHSEHVSPTGPKHMDREETKRAHTSAAEFQNPPEEESLLGSVEDLMVKGYDGNLSFERDFLGEAMDMINTYMI